MSDATRDDSNDARSPAADATRSFTRAAGEKSGSSQDHSARTAASKESADPAATTVGLGGGSPVKGVFSPGDLFGDHEILATLGVGGMGVVYKARQRSANRLVALKVILPERLEGSSTAHYEQASERFTTEAHAAARLDHPHVVTVYEVGQIAGRQFYSMRLVDGRSLAAVLQQGPLAGRRAATYLAPVARALHAAHRQGVLHRDLKPANILIDAATDQAHVTDFGLAKLVEGGRDVTLAGQVFGSPPYMSPEQARNAAQTAAASDIYSLGATLYHMLTGRPPFQAASVAETLRLVLDREPLPPRQLNPTIDRDLETISLKCLAKEPSRRYASAEALADDLERYLQGRSILARPVSNIEKGARWVRRNPALAATMFAASIAVGFALGVVLQLKNVSAERDKVAVERDKTATAEREKQSLLAVSYVAAGRLSMQRGQMREALEFFEKALAGGYEDPVELSLSRIQAWVALMQWQSAGKEIESLAARPNLGRHQGRVLLWRAEFTLGLQGDLAGAEAMFRQALDNELSPADRAYTQGMLAESSPEAVARFEESLELDPFHFEAHGMLTSMLILLGRLEEARARVSTAKLLFPENLTFVRAEAFILACLGRLAEAHAVVARQASRLSSDEQNEWRALLELVDTLTQQLVLLFKPEVNAPGMLVGALGIVSQLQQRIGGSLGAFHLPPIIARKLNESLGQVPALFTFSFARNFRPLKEALAAAVDVHPEGTIYLWLGHAAAADGFVTHGAQAKLDEAIDAYRKAMTIPALGRRVDREARISFVMFEASRLLVQESNGDVATMDRARLADLVEHVRVLAAGPPLPPNALPVFVSVARFGQDRNLARTILATWEKQAPAADPILLMYRMVVEFEDGNNEKTLEAAEQLLAQIPDHATAITHRALAIEKLRKGDKSH